MIRSATVWCLEHISDKNGRAVESIYMSHKAALMYLEQNGYTLTDKQPEFGDLYEIKDKELAKKNELATPVLLENWFAQGEEVS